MMTGLDSLQPLMTKGTAAPVKPRANPSSKTAATPADESSFEETLQSETKSSARRPDSERDSFDSESTKKSNRDELRNERSEPKKKTVPAAVKNDAAPEAPNVSATKDLSVEQTKAASVEQTEYKRPDFFEGTGDESKVKDKVTVERFLTAMKSEVGVPTDQLIRAMSSLPPAAMAQAPQQNMNQIISALQLNPEKQVAAEKLFQGMSATLGEAAVAQDIAKYSPKFLEEQAWLDNVDQISQRFFLRNQGAMAANAIALNNGPQAPLVPNENLKTDEQSKAPFGVALAPVASAAGLAGMGLAAANMSGPKAPGSEKIASMSLGETKSGNLDELLNEMAGEVESVNLSSASAMKPAQLPKANLPNLAAVPLEPSSLAQPMAVAPAVVTFSGLMKGAALSGKSSDKSVKEEGLESLAEGTAAFTGHELRNLDRDGLVPEEFAGIKAPITKEPIQNLQELNQSTATIIKEGGGEVIMKLKPEGLGEVKLKVMVENGRVNVEMIADNPETKRLLESQSLDLKKSLESQMIQVDGLKVDVRDNQTQNERHPQQQAFDREMARDFLGQFRDQNQAFRQSMFELPNVKAYRGNGKQAEEIRPTAPVRSKSDSSKRLNLVA